MNLDRMKFLSFSQLIAGPGAGEVLKEIDSRLFEMLLLWLMMGSGSWIWIWRSGRWPSHLILVLPMMEIQRKGQVLGGITSGVIAFKVLPHWNK